MSFLFAGFSVPAAARNEHSDAAPDMSPEGSSSSSNAVASSSTSSNEAQSPSRVPAGSSSAEADSSLARSLAQIDMKWASFDFKGPELPELSVQEHAFPFSTRNDDPEPPATHPALHAHTKAELELLFMRIDDSLASESDVRQLYAFRKRHAASRGRVEEWLSGRGDHTQAYIRGMLSNMAEKDDQSQSAPEPFSPSKGPSLLQLPHGVLVEICELVFAERNYRWGHLLTLCKAMTRPVLDALERSVAILEAPSVALYQKHLVKHVGAGARCRELDIGDEMDDAGCPHATCALVPFILDKTPALEALHLFGDPGDLYQHYIDGSLFRHPFEQLTRVTLSMNNRNIERLFEEERKLPSAIKRLVLAAPSPPGHDGGSGDQSMIRHLLAPIQIWPASLTCLELRNLDVGGNAATLFNILGTLPKLRVLSLIKVHHLPGKTEMQLALAGLSQTLEAFAFQYGCHHQEAKFMTSPFLRRFRYLRVLVMDHRSMDPDLFTELPCTLEAFFVTHGYMDTQLASLLVSLVEHTNIEAAGLMFRHHRNEQMWVRFLAARGLTDMRENIQIDALKEMDGELYDLIKTVMELRSDLLDDDEAFEDEEDL